MSFANIILPLPLENKYTYRIPQDLEGSITSGCRVIVSFGAKHFYTGLVAEVVDRAPTPGIEYKEIYALLDSAPVLRRPQLRFWEWIASYYICKLGDVYKAALPSGLKLESETTVTLNPGFEADAPLKPTELSVLDALSAIPAKQTASDLARRTGLRNILPILSSLMAKGAIRVGEELRKGYTRKTETFVRIAPKWATDNALREAFCLLQRSPKQEQLLLRFLDLSQALNPALAKELSKQELLEKSAQSIAVLSNLVKRGILEYYEKEVSRLQRHVCRLESLHPLTDAQQAAYEKILDAFRQHETCLLHGATSSGKTSVLNAISGLIPEGERILVLEDSSELQLQQRHCVYFETRKPDKNGEGEFSIRDLVIASLRMRPDRLVIGEIRGGEALDLLQAMNTGHSGSMSTIHANSPVDALRRMETCAILSGVELPLNAVRMQVASAINCIVHTMRLPDGSRKIVDISEVLPLKDGEYRTSPLLKWNTRSIAQDGSVSGDFSLCNKPSFAEDATIMGIELPKYE